MPKDGPLHGDTESVVSDEDVAITIINIIKDVIHTQEVISENTDGSVGEHAVEQGRALTQHERAREKLNSRVENREKRSGGIPIF